MQANRRAFILISLFLIIFFFIVFNPVTYRNLKTNLLYYSLKGQEVVSLATSQRFFLFREFFERKDIVNSMRIAAVLERDAKALEKEQAFYVATSLGQILQADGSYDLEMKMYEIFLKDRYPFLYHLARAGSFEFRKDLRHQREELYLAKGYAEKAGDLKMQMMIGELLQKV